MPIVSLAAIKAWFQTNDEPSQEEFSDTWDSFWHKQESIPLSAIAGLAPLEENIEVAGTMDIPANKLVDTIVLIALQAGSFTVGETPGGSEIDGVILAENQIHTINHAKYYNSQTTLYITGNCTVKIFLR